jgi:hypothetical protein
MGQACAPKMLYKGTRTLADLETITIRFPLKEGYANVDTTLAEHSTLNLFKNKSRSRAEEYQE